MNLDKSSYREFFSVEEANAWGNEYYGKWAEEYKKNINILQNYYETNEAVALDYYCGYAHKEMNSILRNITIPDLSDNRLNFLKTMMKILEFSILFAPRIPENIIVYRTVDDTFMDALNKADLNSGGCAKECGFLSTSLLSKYPIENNYGHLLRIYVSKDEPGMYIPNIIGRSIEQEILFMHNSYIRLLDDPLTSSHSCVNINGYKFYECELINLIPDL